MFIKFENIKEFNKFIKENNIVKYNDKENYYIDLAKTLMRQYSNNIVVSIYMNSGKTYINYCGLRFIPDLENYTITDTNTMKVYEFDIEDYYNDNLLETEKNIIKEIQSDFHPTNDKKMWNKKSDDYIDLECAAEELAKVLLKD